MARGRKAQAPEVKRAKGNPGKRRVAAPAAEHELPASPSAPPARLKGDARKVWQAIAADLVRMKFLRATDVQAFERYCEHLARWRALTADIKRHGETYRSESKHGEMLRVHPDFLVRERVENRLEHLEDRFGLSPRARQEILYKLAQAPPAGLPLTPRGDDEAAREAPGSGGEGDRPASSPVGLLGRYIN